MNNKSKLYQYASKGSWSSQADKFEVLRGIEALEQREADANRKALKHEQIDFGNREVIEMQKQALGELVQREAELEAEVERLREQLSVMAAQHRCGCGHPACNRCRDDVDNRDVLRATPRQNLNAVRREVARESILAAIEDYKREYCGQGIEALFSSFADIYPAKRYPDEE